MDDQRQPDNAAAGDMTGASTPVDWDTHIEFLRGLTVVVQQENLSEVVVESAGLRLTVKATIAGPAPEQIAYYAAPDNRIVENANIM